MKFFNSKISAFSMICFVALLGMANMVSAQYSEPHQVNTSQNDLTTEKSPGNATISSTETPPVLWDIQFNYNSEDSSGFGGQAGVVFLGNEFWVSRWASDTILTFSATGSYTGAFTISGISQIRGMTTDGNMVYAGNASNTIYMINPSNKSQAGTISSPVVVRHISYDSTANSGNGGLWVGNWNTNILLLSMTGSTLATIQASTHGLTGMYGSAFDNTTSGGPYLWIFDQNSSSSQSDIVQLQLPGGTPTGLTHNVMADVGANSSGGLAGGLFITDQLVTNEWTLGGLLQGTPENLLFGYELSDQPSFDANMLSASPTSGYSQIPIKQLQPISFSAEIRNDGSQTLDTVKFEVRIFDTGGSLMFNDISTSTSLASLQSTSLSSSSWTPPNSTGVYEVHALAHTGSNQNDSVDFNDSLVFEISITDSTYARDNGISQGGNGYAVSQTSWGYAIAMWDIINPDTVTSVSVQIENPVQGDTTFPVVVSVSNQAPLNVVAAGPPTIINTQNNYTMQIPGGYAVNTGQIAIGVYEGANTTINLSQSPSFFVQDMNWFYTPASGWIISSIETARFIRPNFGSAKGVSRDLEELAGQVQIYPNPARGSFRLDFNLRNESDVEVEVLDARGAVVHHSDLRNVFREDVGIDLSSQPSGMYIFRIKSGDKVMNRKAWILK